MTREQAQVILYSHAVRAQQYNVPSTLTSDEWLDILARYENRCAYCDATGKLTVDHVHPLSRGGGNVASNVVPACAWCNASKGDRTVEEWKSVPRTKIEKTIVIRETGPLTEEVDLETIPQAAARLGLTRAALDRPIAKGLLPIVGTWGEGRVRLVRAADVDAWRAAPKHKGGRPRRADPDGPQDTPA